MLDVDLWPELPAVSVDHGRISALSPAGLDDLCGAPCVPTASAFTAMSD
jgi:hypothetical protein